jgi:putative DNA primase/helicase
LETAATAMIFAKRGTYKTHFAMSVGYAIATGGELLAWKVHKAARVLYVDGELPTALLQKPLQLLGTPTDNLVILSRDIMLRTRERTLPDLGQEEGRKFLDQIIEAQQIDVVMLDSLSTLIRSRIENEAESWAPIQDWMLMHRFRERSVVLVHHEGKSGHQRGTTKREDVLDTIIRLKEREQAEGDDEGLFELRFEKTRGFYGIDTAPLIVRLATKSGTAEWTRETVKDHIRDRVRELSQQDLPQKEIAKELGLTQGRVSQILSEIRAEKTQ